MNLKRKFKYFVASFLMLASTITPLGNGLVRSVYADEPADAPVRSKTLKDNGDGTYTLTLSVTGKASSSTQNTKANVVVVFDSSGSMDDGTGGNKYEERTYGRYGLVDGEYVQLYYYGNGRYRDVGNNDNHSTVYYVDESSSTGYTQYSGTRYRQAAETRLDVAKSAVNGLAEKLLEHNTTSGVSDMVEMAFVDFASNVKTSTTHTTPTTSIETFESWVNATSANGGTNWEAALSAAKNVNFNDTDPTYIVFVSDGNPTYRLTSMSDQYGRSDPDDNWQTPSGVHGAGGSDNYGFNLLAAQNMAATIVTNKTLYAVGVFGNADNMRNLNSQAIYKDATDQAALEAAFNDIVKSITNSLSLTGLIFNDGITGMTSVAVEGTAGGFTYTKGGNNWADAPAAKFENGTVTWDLGDTVLADGETATVSFIVYPSQESLDLIADLNNGKVSYDGLSADQKSQIIKNGNKYTLKTNTDSPTLTYKTVTTTTVDGQTTTKVSDPKTVPITNPDPVDLYQEEAELQKLWEDSLDPSQREDEVEDIHLQFFKKDYGKSDYEEYDQFHQNYETYTAIVDGEEVELSGIKVQKVEGSNKWTSGKISIAPGLMVSEGHAAFKENAPYGVITATINGQTKRYAILNPGHDYKFGEADINSHFELTNYIYHPMLVDGTLMNVTFTKSGNTFTGVESAKPMSTVSATNTIKGGINVQKKVFDENNQEVKDSKDAFNVKVTLKDADGNDYTDTDYRIYFGENNPCYSTKCDGVSDDDFAKHRTGHITPGTGVVEETLYEGDTIRFVNVETGVVYATEESNIPKGYSLIGTDHTIKYGSDGEEETDKVAKVDGGLNYYAVAGNSASTAVIKNRYVSGNLEISKTVNADSGNETTAQQKEFRFRIKIYADATKATELTTPYKIDGSDDTLKSGDTFTLKHGETIKLLKLPDGAYYEIVEEGVFINGEFKEFTDDKNYGFATRTARGDTGTIAKNDTKTAAFTNTYSVSGKVAIKMKKEFNDWQNGESFLFKLNGDGLSAEGMSASVREGETATFEVPINDIGTYRYTVTEDVTNLRGGIEKVSDDVAIVVVATDNGDGTLSFETTYGGEAAENGVIENHYSASGKVTLGASKLLTGRDWQDGELYTFTLYDEDGNVLATRDDIKKDGSYDLDEITYTTEDDGKTFVYVIRETSTLPGGMTNSGDITATVEVKDNHDGTMSTTVVYKDKNGNVTNTIVNTYAANGEYTLKATKELVGRAWKQGESYQFVLKDSDGNTIGEPKTVSANGEVSFDAIKFTQADDGKTYTYTIGEAGTMPGGMTNSGDITATIKVTDDKQGNLNFEVNYTGDGKIVNTYKATGEVELEATKELTGRVWQEGESFDFELSGGNLEEAETVAVTEAKPTAKFKKITYSEADAGKTYTYTIKETTDLTGMNIDYSGDITVTVKVTDNGDGTLKTDVTYSKADKKITNAYSAEGSVTLEAEKKLEGRAWKEGEKYEFALKDAAGKVIESVDVEGDGIVKFSPIDYTKVGTYNYTIEETTEMTPGMSKSDPIAVEVEVTDNFDGTLTATATYDPGNKLITNTYKANGQIELEITKELEGRDWKDGESYTFELRDKDESGESYGTKTISGENGTVKFDALKYTEADINKTYNFVISEVSDLPNGVTSSGDVDVAVTIKDNGDGTLKVTAEYTNDGTITNTYEADGKIKLEATKVIEGRDWLDSDSFTFELFDEDGNSLGDKTITKGTDGHKAVFDEITYSEKDAGKTFTYTIKETTDLSNLSMKKSDDITVTVKVTDDGEGNLEVTPTYSNNGKITNTYTAKGEAEISAQKILKGRDWLKNESYQFVLKDSEGKTIESKTVTENGNVAFTNLKYTEADAGKAYTYTITEEGSMPGVTKSGDITVTVKLTDDGKGKIAADVSYTNEGTITNTYKAKGEIELEVEKKLVGRDWQDNESYTFELTDESKSYGKVSIGNDGKVKFEALKYTEEDAGQSYNFTISEVSDLPNGVTGSGDIKVTVTVEDNGDGTLEVSAKYTNEGRITNTYEAEGKAKLEITKAIEGRDWLDSDSFTFELFDKDGKSLDEATVTKDSEGHKAAFDEISYDESDAGKSFTYTIKETTDLSNLSMTKSDDVTATVKVTDNGDGTLKTEVSYTDEGTITNTYTAKGEVTLEAEKELVGRGWLDNESYDFVLKKGNETIDTKTVDANEKVSFKTINYTEADAGETYTYTITEEGSMPGVTKSDDITVTVKLTDDGKGKISAEVSYTNGGKITNTYETNPVTVKVPFTVIKKVTDESNSGKQYADSTFKFELLNEKGEKVQEKEVKTEDLTGSVAFDAMTFDKAGTYTYTLIESNDGQSGFKYDETKHNVVIKVTDEPENAQLVAEVKIDGKVVGEVEFDNSYKAEEAYATISIEKKLTGIDQELAKEFEFVLSDKDGEIQTIKIKGSGTADFDEIKYEKAGTYEYTVVEKDGGAKGYTYDGSVYTVTVNVTDNGSAQLETAVSFKKDGAEVDSIVFENSYEPEEVEYGCPECVVPIEAKKILEGRKLKGNEFKFEVYLDGELVATGYNLANGKIVLDNSIVFDEAGTYNLVIKENTENADREITYDTNEYEFTVEVVDEGEGELKVQSDTSCDVTFTNKYNEPGHGGNTPKPPVTYDGIMSSVMTLAISTIGLLGSVLFSRRCLTKKQVCRK